MRRVTNLPLRRQLSRFFPMSLALLAILPLACQRGRENNKASDRKTEFSLPKPADKVIPWPMADVKHFEVDLGPGIKIKLVRIEPVKFVMGSPKAEQDYVRQQNANESGNHAKDELGHEVEIVEPFYIGVYPITQAEYENVMRRNPSYFGSEWKAKAKESKVDTSRFPVDQVSWDDAIDFCRNLSQRDNKRFDLPTEAEWEYACRAGSTGAFHYGNSLSSTQANFNGNYPYGADKGPFLKRPTEVGSYESNAFGLYDMHGNVFQWCKDWYQRDYYDESPIRNPQGPSTGNRPCNPWRCLVP